MHLKIIPPDSWDFGDNATRLIKIASGGLGSGGDFRSLVKLAGDKFAFDVANLPSFNPDLYLPMHLRAMGATEMYGPNRNGDGFKSANLQRTHPTFVKHAHFYRHHCFVAKTPVLLADRTRVPICDVGVGDKVVTSRGAKPVTAVFRRHYRGPGVRVYCNGISAPLVATTEHPILLLKRDQVHCKHRYNLLGAAAHFLHSAECRNQFCLPEPHYHRAGDVEIGDYMLVPLPKQGRRRIEPSLARLLGWVGSEGNLGSRGAIQFTFSTSNEADIVAVHRCLQENGLNVTVTVRDDGLTQLAACSAVLHAVLRQYVTGTKDKKRFTAEILQLHPASLLELLSVYADGDGHIGKGRNLGQLRIRSSSPGMLASLADIMRSLRLAVGVNQDGRPGRMRSPTNGKQYASRGSGVVAVSAGQADTLTERSRKHSPRNSSRASQQLIYRGYQLVRVRRVENIALDEEVFNLEVSGPHDYVANEVVVHNCNKDPKKSYGQVKLSSFYDPMKCVDLLVLLNRNEKAAKENDNLVADEECQSLESGKSLAVSMSCKIAHDVCSVCENKARTRKEYCKSAEEGGKCPGFGCSSGLTKVSSSGHIQHVDNPDPLFTDISKVHRGADRVAFGELADYMHKAASEGYVPGGAELAEAFGLVTPLELLLPTIYDNKTAAQVKLAYELAAIEDFIDENKNTQTVRPLDRGLQSSNFRAADLEVMGAFGTRKFATALGALAEQGSVLSVQDFLRVLLGGSSEKIAAYVDSVPRHLPGVFNRLISTPGFETELRDNPFLPAGEPAPAYQREWAQKQASLLSLSPDKIQLRASLSAIRDYSSPRFLHTENTKTAADSANAEGLARAYAMYKIAFLRTQLHSLPLTAELLVRQNYIA
jgi:hypothetical protein